MYRSHFDGSIWSSRFEEDLNSMLLPRICDCGYENECLICSGKRSRKVHLENICRLLQYANHPLTLTENKLHCILKAIEIAAANAYCIHPGKCILVSKKADRYLNDILYMIKYVFNEHITDIILRKYICMIDNLIDQFMMK
jgi:hypothetical protein